MSKEINIKKLRKAFQKSYNSLAREYNELFDKFKTVTEETDKLLEVIEKIQGEFDDEQK